MEECEPPNTDIQRGIQGQKAPIFNPKSPNLEGGLSQICSIFTELAKNNSIDSNGEFTGRKSDSNGKIIEDSNGEIGPKRLNDSLITKETIKNDVIDSQKDSNGELIVNCDSKNDSNGGSIVNHDKIEKYIIDDFRYMK